MKKIFYIKTPPGLLGLEEATSPCIVAQFPNQLLLLQRPARSGVGMDPDTYSDVKFLSSFFDCEQISTTS
jgi:hypothetical protein